jgi:dipeptidyl aminopeptidase/acylaminoacyl peptidase
MLIVVTLMLLIVASGFYFFSNSTSKPTSLFLRPIFSPTPTPLPFEELTIPYLRKQEYKSSLGELNKVSENSLYTSYLTSYSSDGLKINGLLTIPKPFDSAQGGGSKFPAIIFIHGYIPPTLYTTLERYTDYVDYLARNGFVVFKIDLRGHGDSEGSPGGGYFGSDYVVDTLNAYAALQSSDFVNPQAIGLWGHSMAGNIIMRSFAVKPEIPAVVIWAGAVYSYVDRDKYGINDNSYRPPGMSTANQSRRQQLFEKHGSPSAQSTFWQQVAPTNYLNDLRGAIQINHAVDDDVVNVGYSRDLTLLLDKTSVVHELWEYPSGGHNISGSSFVTAMERTVLFFKKYLVE